MESQSEMEFWGAEVKVGESVKVDPELGYIHISLAALGEVKKDKATGPVVVYVKVDGVKLVVGTLIKDAIPHTTLNIVLDRVAELSHNSKHAAVYFSGYKVLDDGDYSDESDSEAELAPLTEPAEAAKELGKPAAETGAVAKQVVKPVKVEGESDSDSDSSEEFDSDSEDSESEEETPTPAKKVGQGKSSKGTNENAPKAPVPTKKAKIATPEKTDSDSDEDISDEDISDDDISDEDSSDEETPVQKGKNNKRPNEAAPQTPVSAKKAKNATPGKTDGKKAVHIATPHPMKKSGKTPQNGAKDQSPSSSKSKKNKQGRR